jgi:hypothetical protein
VTHIARAADLHIVPPAEVNTARAAAEVYTVAQVAAEVYTVAQVAAAAYTAVQVAVQAHVAPVAVEHRQALSATEVQAVMAVPLFAAEQE